MLCAAFAELAEGRRCLYAYLSAAFEEPPTQARVGAFLAGHLVK